MMVIVKKPGIDVPLAERGLDGGKIHGQTTILNKGRVLGESGCETGGWWDKQKRPRLPGAI